MTIYHAWSGSMYKMIYSAGYYATREMAEEALLILRPLNTRTASGSDFGIDEIEVFERKPVPQAERNSDSDQEYKKE